MPGDRPRVPQDVIFFDFLLFLDGLELYFFTFFCQFPCVVLVWCCMVLVLVCGVVWCWCVVLYGAGVWCCDVGSGAKRGGGVGRRRWHIHAYIHMSNNITSYQVILTLYRILLHHNILAYDELHQQIKQKTTPPCEYFYMIFDVTRLCFDMLST